MYSTAGKSAIATAITSGKTEVHTPQRKARLYDKQRVRLKDVKGWALKRCGCSSSTEVKKYLKQLGTVLDLRMTSAWIAINSELAPAIIDLKEAATYTGSEVLFSPGDRVIWAQRLRESTLPPRLLDNAPAYIHSCWGWLPICQIENELAWLEGWAGDPVASQ